MSGNSSKSSLNRVLLPDPDGPASTSGRCDPIPVLEPELSFSCFVIFLDDAKSETKIIYVARLPLCSHYDSAVDSIAYLPTLVGILLDLA